MERQEKIKRRDEVRALFEGKMYEGAFIYSTHVSLNEDMMYLYDDSNDCIFEFPYYDRHEHAEKCYKEFPVHFTLSEDYHELSIEHKAIFNYLKEFSDRVQPHQSVTINEMENEFKRRVKELL